MPQSSNLNRVCFKRYVKERTFVVPTISAGLANSCFLIRDELYMHWLKCMRYHSPRNSRYLSAKLPNITCISCSFKMEPPPGPEGLSPSCGPVVLLAGWEAEEDAVLVPDGSAVQLQSCRFSSRCIDPLLLQLQLTDSVCFIVQMRTC